MTTLMRFDDELFWSTPDAALDRPVIGLIAASGGTLMFDACGSHRHAAELQREMAAHGVSAPDLCVISHSHADHWFGLVDFEAPAVCSRACQAATRAMTTMDWTHDGYRRLVDDGTGNAFLADILDQEYGVDRERIPLRSPELGIHGELTIDLGSLTAEVREVVSSHSGDAVLLWLPQKKVVFLGDLLYLRGNDEEEVRDILAELDRLDAEWFIDAHVDGVLTREQIEIHLREYVKGL